MFLASYDALVDGLGDTMTVSVTVVASLTFTIQQTEEISQASEVALFCLLVNRSVRFTGSRDIHWCFDTAPPSIAERDWQSFQALDTPGSTLLTLPTLSPWVHTISWAIIPPMLMPMTWTDLSPTQPR